MMKSSAVTLIHKGAMDIGVHAVATFRRHFAESHRLDIHNDGSLDEGDLAILREAAEGMEVRMVGPADRQPILRERLAEFPKIRAMLDGCGYFAKLELPMCIPRPYFYFDSDIVWLRGADSFAAPDRPNAFSTESWSWYNGVANDREWIREQIPRRVNSGFYYLSEEFPFARMESMLERGLFDPTLPYNTDQEIMAYLFPDMELYDPEDLKRSRRNVQYDFAMESCAALHFPGQMWRAHLDDIATIYGLPEKPPLKIRHQPAVPLSRGELLRMRMAVKISDSPVFGGMVNRLRAIRARFA
ncbi:hypothetical protein OKA05_13280 [Luteolibacter arcticus]|uniref:Uncharacterized protein n=1 Tax=Luteolibacter arcticus TaxID=1581411 RepID=A0ABT3GJ31_9BACT|nr:hypothetical protein [Luteolibacter arcticus]MCW1923530.1 hypothetical protein [Luteolibacter arcticus]